nr:thioredoxin family protein [Rubripirellula obstinata]
MLPLGTTAPSFALANTDGKTITLESFADKKALLVIFMCNHCPFVKHVAEGLKSLTDEYMAQDVGVVAISSNDAEKYPDDSPEAMAKEIVDRGYGFDYLYDADQSVAIEYAAACTPDFFLFDAEMKLAYRGQLDSSRPNSGIPVTGEDLRAALDAVLAGQSPSADQKPSIGCNIKWNEGSEPDYFNPQGTA